MGMNRITRRIVACIACWAMLFAALAPSLAQATAGSKADFWAEICSVGGTRLVKLSVDQAGQDMVHVKHCPFCATHADAVTMPQSAGFVLPVLQLPESYPFLFFHAPRPLQAWTVAQSRAPPAVS
jgi:hypothetical protein